MSLEGSPSAVIRRPRTGRTLQNGEGRVIREQGLDEKRVWRVFKSHKRTAWDNQPGIWTSFITGIVLH